MSADLTTATTARPVPEASERRVGPFTGASHRRRYTIVAISLVALAVAIAVLLLTWNVRPEPFSDSWWRVVSMRVSALVVIAIVTLCQSFATVTFQTVTSNRIITPSIMGFESLYILIQTAIVYFFGVSGLAGIGDLTQFLIQATLMVVFAVLLYSWLLSGRLGNLHIMLLVGIVIGAAFGSMATFMQRMLDPNEFDVLTAQLFGNVGNADTRFFIVVVPVVVIIGLLLFFLAPRLNVIALGSDISSNLGLAHKRQLMVMLTLVAVLMAMTTALVGPMMFLGFLSATLAYSLTDTYDHRRILPVAWLVGFVVLGGAYFLLRHVFSLVDAVTVIIELVGGVVFLAVLLRKGRL